MFSEQPESTQEQGGQRAQSNITQQATASTPVTRSKHPKRVAAGKMVAKHMQLVREAQKKAAAEASVIIMAKKSGVAANLLSALPTALAAEDKTASSGLSTT